MIYCTSCPLQSHQEKRRSDRNSDRQRQTASHNYINCAIYSRFNVPILSSFSVSVSQPHFASTTSFLSGQVHPQAKNYDAVPSIEQEIRQPWLSIKKGAQLAHHLMDWTQRTALSRSYIILYSGLLYYLKNCPNCLIWDLDIWLGMAVQGLSTRLGQWQLQRLVSKLSQKSTALRQHQYNCPELVPMLLGRKQISLSLLQLRTAPKL